MKPRISNHKLMIEIDRYNQTTKDNRHCLFCGSNQIEDKDHFLFHCPTYSMITNKFYNKVKTLIPNITQLPINGLINELMNFSNYFINIQFIKYISACFDVRDKFIIKVTLLPCDVILILKNSFCNTVSACMVMHIKFVVVVVTTGTYMTYAVYNCSESH